MYDPKQDLGAQGKLLDSIMSKAVAFSQHIDSQSNIIIGISSALFAFSASKIQLGTGDLLYYILGFFSGLSAITALLAVHPPSFMRHKNQTQSVMHNRSISSLKSASDYEKELNKITGDMKAITKQYAIEIYNLNKYYYSPKRRLFRISRNILLLGILLTLLYLTFVR